MKKLTTDEYKNKLYEKYKNEYELIGDYINSTTEVEFFHLTCGSIFKSKPAPLLTGQDKCPCLKRKPLDLTNKKFGKLTALYMTKEFNYIKYWMCQCDCGKYVEVRQSNLSSGHTQSCGCLVKETNHENFSKDYIGQKFGMLTVLERADDYISPSGFRNSRLKCQCECGNIKIASLCDLKSGHVKSCGCLKKETNKNKIKSLVGQKFGKLEVIKLLDERTHIGKNNISRVMYLCKCDCGNIVKVSQANLKNEKTSSCGCINSKNECLIGKYLRELNINFEPQYRFKDCRIKKPLPFDFGILKNGMPIGVIEYDGEGHYLERFYGSRSNDPRQSLINTQNRDSIKTQYCLDNNIPLLRIPYFEKENYKELINVFLATLAA